MSRTPRFASPRNPMAFMAVAALVVLPTAAFFSALASAAEPDASQIALPARVSRLANGLEVILHEDHRTPIVAVNVWYHVGAKDEAPGLYGFAHLFEHVMFQGSKHVPEDTYFKFLERAGASNVNGTTDADRTNYFETVPKNRLELALWLESDRMGFLLDHVDEATFSGQRSVVKNERRQNYENAPYGLVGQAMDEAIFPPQHPYRHLAIGSPQDLDAATLDDIRSFFRAWYVPNNATLVIAGDVEPQATLALVDRYFGPIPGHALPARPEPPKAVLNGETRLELEAGVELPQLRIAWITPPYFATGDADLDLLARILAASKTSRLYKRLVYDDQIAQDVTAYQESRQLVSQFEIVATAKPGHTPDQLLTAIDQELARVQSDGVRDEELARARTALLATEAFGLETVGARANKINTFVHYTGDAGYLAKDIARYVAVSPGNIGYAARSWLPMGKRVVAVVRPVQG
ncbi:MAG: insulinase family protein, partial [Myxococcota bacterium]|nr:insulinase family protein [Myxococcota bacterium]